MTVDELEISDSELTMQALAADPDEPFDDDAVPFGGASQAGSELLPEWYMPLAHPIRRTRGRAFAVTAIVIAMLFVNGAGLCVTYGLPEIAW